MHTIQTLNKISPVIFDALTGDYEVGDTVLNPEAILVRSADMHAFTLPDSVLAVGRAGAGVNNIPVDAYSEKGVVVFNTPGANANAVAELVVAGMLLASRDIVGGMQWAQTLKGQGAQVPALVEKGKGSYVGPELRGKTLGVIGLGAVGALVANAAIGLGMVVVGFDPFISVQHAWTLSRSVHRAASQAELIAASDYVTVHVPLLPETRGLFGTALLDAMKPGATLLNFSRGELVDTEAALAALQSGHLRRYVTDFPMDALLGVPGVLAIPHLGASTPESEDNCAHMAAAQLRDYLETGAVRNSVNLPDVELARFDGTRLAVLHDNIPNVIAQVTSTIAGQHINIANMVNKSRGRMAYTVLDLDAPADDALTERLGALGGVFRVRVIQG